ncbi:Gfo/Idh/MocA family oxidoreductase [Alteromonas sp. BMJM2]|uniref:Gfo/Idh/MocA family oxidoreductase n=1 Tax=Alteromonas sp. BMJM2 TaxID=2954241 RepID=UPI0022B4A1AC|nr:Gfo/Idh/MocA family oxidoreductase [Alteromonas sp. BMJM2]
MKIAFLGCGYVANMYRLTLASHHNIELIGVYDRETSRAKNLANLTNSHCYSSFEELLADKNVDCVLNLTTPEEHYITTRRILESSKHVYTEKPIAMDLEEASELVELAESKALLLVSAPCTLLNNVAQTCWRLLQEKEIGNVKLVYAEMDDGMISKAPLSQWINEAGIAWPYVNEFETGCTVEHAGYVLTWLTAFFGPAVKMASFSDQLLDEKVPNLIVDSAPDFSVATIKFTNGTVARLTNGIYADHDHRLRFFGEDGVITVEDPRSDNSSIFIQKYKTIRRRRFLSPIKKKIKVKESGKIGAYRGSQVRDFCRSLANMANSIENNQEPYLTANHALHVNELTLACQHPESFQKSGHYYIPTTSFKPMKPEESLK